MQCSSSHLQPAPSVNWLKYAKPRTCSFKSREGAREKWRNHQDCIQHFPFFFFSLLSLFFFLPLIYLKIKKKKATGLTSKNVAGIQSSSRHKRDTLLHLPHSALLTSVWQKQQKHNDVIHSYHWYITLILWRCSPIQFQHYKQPNSECVRDQRSQQPDKI